MALPSRERETPEFDRIAPAVISPAEDRDSAARQPAALRSAVAGAGLLILCLTAVAVVFVLPKWVTPVRLAEMPVAAPLSAPQGAAEVQPASKAPGADPAERAQQARLRLESQDALAEMLAAQKALQPMHAEVWAAEAYAAGLAKAEAGHQAYRTQQFEEAKSGYAEASAAFRQLLEQSTQVFAAAMQRGEKALQEGDSATATQAFETALLIRPSDAAAAKGARRARTLDEVNSLLAQGDDLREKGELPAAREAYQQAVRLDPDAEAAKSGLELVARMTADREFTRAMSAGYAALQADNLEAARRAFGEALKVKPGAADAKSGLSLAAHRLTSIRIAGLLEQGARLKHRGQWEQAASTYEAALAVDPSLLPAQEGQLTAAQRAKLDARLVQAIAQPERLANKNLYREASSLLDQARRVDHPDERLKQQITELSALLQKVLIPLPVRLQSDNTTEVTIYKVAPLGRFASKELSLRPGHYVAVGKRPGYRDVRVEFTVRPDHPVPPIVLQCQEKIA